MGTTRGGATLESATGGGATLEGESDSWELLGVGLPWKVSEDWELQGMGLPWKVRVRVGKYWGWGYPGRWE